MSKKIKLNNQLSNDKEGGLATAPRHKNYIIYCTDFKRHVAKCSCQAQCVFLLILQP